MTKLFLKLLYRLNLIKWFNFQITKKINGKKVIIPILNGTGFNMVFNNSEPWMDEVLNKIINHKSYSGIFLDVGVNLGQTLLKVKSINENIEYIGFEPNPHCVYYVNELIKANNFKSLNAIPVGISKENTLLELSLFSESETDSAASIIPDFRDKQAVKGKLFVPVFEVNTLKFLNDENIGLIKIDVEGAELEVIQGFENIIMKYKPLILMEILPVYSSENTKRLERQRILEEMLKQKGYDMFRIAKHDTGVKFNLIEEIGIHSNIEDSDYFMIPKDKKIQFDNIL